MTHPDELWKRLRFATSQSLGPDSVTLGHNVEETSSCRTNEKRASIVATS
jgi:hypothetical protein